MFQGVVLILKYFEFRSQSLNFWDQIFIRRIRSDYVERDSDSCSLDEGFCCRWAYRWSLLTLAGFSSQSDPFIKGIQALIWANIFGRLSALMKGCFKILRHRFWSLYWWLLIDNFISNLSFSSCISSTNYLCVLEFILLVAMSLFLLSTYPAIFLFCW